jgi:hypothetical protein
MHSEVIYTGEGSGRTSLTGEVIFELMEEGVRREPFKSLVHRAIERQVGEIASNLLWASYLVVISPGRDSEEVRCQVDLETSASHAAFAIGYGGSSWQAFHDAMERLQWYEKENTANING